jgi:hypothetical protein
MIMILRILPLTRIKVVNPISIKASLFANPENLNSDETKESSNHNNPQTVKPSQMTRNYNLKLDETP